MLAAYGGVFIVGSLLWGVAFDGFRPDRAARAGARGCLVGVGVSLLVAVLVNNYIRKRAEGARR